MKKNNSLSSYRGKRDFKKSPEPRGAKKKSSKKPIFVIQMHDATRLHYDFRLEVNGVLKSWAVPKGPSTDPKEKRLAIPTEDHPIAYAQFEGVIPEGNYGAGPVMIWDEGTYENLKEKNGVLIPMETCIKNGRVEIFLHGHKLQGGYALVRTTMKEGDKEQWLLIKLKDEYADARRRPTKTQNRSVITNRTIQEIKKGTA